MKNTYKANLTMLISIVLSLFLGFIIEFFPENLKIMGSQYLFILLPSILYIIISKKDFKYSFRLNKLSFKSLLIVLGITFAMNPFLMFISAIAAKLFGSSIAESLVESAVNAPFWISVLSIAVTPAICEEALLRGVIMDGYRNVNVKKMILLNGLLFGLFHLNLHQFAYTFIMGIVLAGVVYITDSIFASMIIHFTNNLLSVILMYMGKDVDPTASMEAAGYSIGNILIIAAIIIVSILVTLWLFKLLYKENRDKDINRDYIFYEESPVNWPFIVNVVITSIISIAITVATYIVK